MCMDADCWNKTDEISSTAEIWNEQPQKSWATTYSKMTCNSDDTVSWTAKKLEGEIHCFSSEGKL